MEAVQNIMNTKADTEVRNLRRMEINSAIQQGDVYLHRVDVSHPRGDKLGTRQVAVGDNIGARHVVEGKISVFSGKKLPETFKSQEFKNELLGPVVVAEDKFTLGHPEHAHHCLPAGTYQVTYQLDYATKERVQD